MSVARVEAGDGGAQETVRGDEGQKAEKAEESGQLEGVETDLLTVRHRVH